jgi:hypothetical protein
MQKCEAQMYEKGFAAKAGSIGRCGFKPSALGFG